MRHTIRRRSLIGAAGLSVAALVLAGCAGAAEEPAADGGTTDSGGSEETAEVAAGCEAYADYAGNEGTEVEIYTTIVDPEASLFIESFVEFEECTGIDITWNGDQSFEEQIAVRIEGGTAPDLAVFPQPGKLAEFADAALPLSDAIASSVAENYPSDWVPYGEIDGVLKGTPLGANVKSFVWYSPKVFADNGWEIPETWDELLSLTDEIASGDSGVQPWCIGIESGAATGWVLTDWMEDLMLRVHDGETYDRWTGYGDTRLAFNSPEVSQVLTEAEKIVKNADYVGNVPAMATTTFQDGGSGIVDGSCAMHKQASFIGGILVGDHNAEIVTPEDTDVENGITTFYFPGVTADQRPALAGGEFVAAFQDRPEVEAVQRYLTSPEWNNKKASLGGWISLNQGLDPANVDDTVNRASVEILQSATLIKFDGADLMPAGVGTGSFWTEMTAWVAEDKANDAVLDAIEATWPDS